MAPRSYHQYCGLAHALELVGERWALLVVRNLLTGPKRFTDLRNGLPRIPTNVLSTRLKELEEGGIVGRRVLPRPSGSVVYELTDYGRGLEDAVLSLARWGTKSIGEPDPSDVINSSAFALGLRSAFHPDAARGLTATYEVCFGNAVVHLRVDDGEVEAQEGPADEPDLKIATDAALPALLRGDLSPAEAERTGAVRLTGDARLLERFTAIFRLD
jgi:DNA-binding HxlR family transcriptional regulator